MRSISLFLALIWPLAGFGCRTAATSGRAAVEPCFFIRDVRSFSPIDQRFVYVQVRSDRHYLLTLNGIYPTLPQALRIAISERFGSRVCSDTASTLTYSSIDGDVSARILRVEPVASKEAALKLVDERTGRKPEK